MKHRMQTEYSNEKIRKSYKHGSVATTKPLTVWGKWPKCRPTSTG
ncbi:unnamed protein product, partial [Allacma fusca]